MEDWFHSYSKNTDSEIVLVCFHFSGGGASTFRDWHSGLPNFVDVVCAQLPGRETRFKEPLTADLGSVVNRLASAIEEHLDKPFVFFGHSLGALIAYQLALELSKRESRTPEHVIVSGRPAPGDSQVYYPRLGHLPDDEFMERLSEYGGMSQVLLSDNELMKLFLPILRADFQLSETHNIERGKIDCPLSVFGGVEDRVGADKLELWKDEASGDFAVHVFPGAHFFILESRAPVLSRLCEILTTVRTRA